MKSRYNSSFEEIKSIDQLHHDYISTVLPSKKYFLLLTVHNAYNIEKNLEEFVQTILDQLIEEITFKCEILIRAKDPCIFCSADYYFF